MISLDTIAQLMWEVSVDHAASEIDFFNTVISPWDQDQTGNKTCQKLTNFL